METDTRKVLAMKWTLTLLAVACLAQIAPAEELTVTPGAWRKMRELVLSRDKDEDLVAALAQLKKQDKVTAVAIAYDCLLWDPQAKQLRPLDEGIENHVFNVGDRVVFTVKTFSDCYIYVFHRGPGGVPKCLFPPAEEKPVKVSAGVTEYIPTGGRPFVFTPPAGVEELVLVASAAPIDDLEAAAREQFADRERPEEEVSGSILRMQQLLREKEKQQGDVVTAPAPALPEPLGVRLSRGIFLNRPTRGEAGLLLAQVSPDASQPVILNVKLRSK